MARPKEKDERINLRVPSEAKEDMEHAAALLGMSLTQFILTEATERAREVIRLYQSVRISDRQSEAFIEQVMKPLPAERALVELFEAEG